jgi:protein-S-isoprenylcysteine O-methyltransferase Ste14
VLAEKGGSLRLVLLAAGWTSFCALHSAMISETATKLLRRRLGDGYRFYRLFFNAVAVLSFIPLVSSSLSAEGPPLFRWTGTLLGVRYALLACSALLFFAGGRHYSLKQFLGISQLRRRPSAGLASGGGIDSTGVLGLVRHPWYTAVLLLLWARDVDAVRLVANAVLTVYVVVGTRLEERKLVHEFGDTYVRYQERVSMFVPLKWLRSRGAD